MKTKVIWKGSKLFRDIADKLSGPHSAELTVGDMFVVEREIDRKVNYNICLFTGDYLMDKLVYEEYDKHKIAEARGEEYDGEKPAEGEGDEHLYEHFRKFLVNRFKFRREQIMVCEIINKNNDKKLHQYLQDAKVKDMPYCEFIGNLKDLPVDWAVLNSGFLSEQNDYAVTTLVKNINDYFARVNEELLGTADR